MILFIIPLILSSIVSGVTNIGTGENLGRLTFKTFSYYIITSILAILTGLILVNTIAPGIGADMGLAQSVENIQIIQESFGRTLINIVPTNIFQAFVENKSTIFL